MHGKKARPRSRSVLWVRWGTVAVVVVALALFGLNLVLDPLESYSSDLIASAPSIGLLLTSIVLVGAFCEGVLRLPWDGAKPFVYAATVIPALGGLAAIALPEWIQHLLTLDDSIGYSLGRGLNIVSILAVPLAGAIALMTAVAFDSRWFRVLPSVALAIVLTVAARELALSIFAPGWCPETVLREVREFPMCTGLTEEGTLAPVTPLP